MTFKITSRLYRAFFAATAVGAFCAPAYAQTSTSDANAEIQISSAVTKQADLQFGTVIAGTGASTVVVEPYAGNRSVTGTAVAYGGTVSAARFKIDARPLVLYIISVPNSIEILNTADASKKMTVNNFTLNGSALRLMPFGLGTGNFQVGGRLNVKANQEPGDYEGSFNVTVNFL